MQPKDVTKVFTPIVDAYVTAGAPITDRLRSAEADNLDHCRETILNPDIHTAALAHAHRGDESAHLSAMPSTPNLLREGFIGNTNLSAWILHGCTLQRNGIRFAGANEWATHALVDADRPSHSRSVFGAGCDLVVSGYLYASGTLTAGMMAMGLTDGGKGKDEDSKAFVAGTRVLIPYTVLEQGWTRVWAILPNVGGRFDKAVRFVVQCEQSMDGGTVTANLLDVRPGRMLDFYTHGYHSDPYLEWHDFGNVLGPPPFDQAMAFDDAVELSPMQE